MRESAGCPLCMEPAGALLRASSGRGTTGTSYAVARCAGCGHLYTTPLPAASELAGLYEADFYGCSPGRPPAFSWLRRLLHRQVLRHREAALSGRPAGRLLDVGCGDGDFLLHMSRRGWHVEGADPSPAACDLASRRGIPVRCGTLDGSAFPAAAFDAVTFWHALEHLPDPRAALRESSRLLAPGGLLVVEVPNADSPFFRVCGDDWYPLDLPRHLHHFTAPTLERLLLETGFAVVRRRDVHLADGLLALISVLARFGPLGRCRGAYYFLSEYRAASPVRKAAFWALGALAALPVAALSWTTAGFTGKGETMTLIASKVPSPADARRRDPA